VRISNRKPESRYQKSNPYDIAHPLSPAFDSKRKIIPFQSKNNNMLYKYIVNNNSTYH